MIDWLAFVIVALVSVIAAAVVVVLFAGGLRLLAVEGSPTWARVCAVVCFAVSAAGALFGIWLIIPQFHGG
ncbi:hypothetical protein [Frondihabitans australicus]|uniref:Uncharacterized protein n=1 Tax=Frondihabitans australicus TaxID=386892 RepID=A0A495IEW2_9MICO|nr:hypothetical protein [Frondihabitans australicus]RKR74534.1 hypothetical protein C8E83_1653 [Frondihabitans australicus]